MNKEQLEQLVREFLQEKLQPRVLRAEPPAGFGPEDRLDTGNPNDRVYTRDLFSLSQSPRLGAGWMQIDGATFFWQLHYDEIDYVVSGCLEIHTERGVVTGHPGDVLYLPKGSRIQFSAPEHARFLYVTYPADWQNAGK